MGSILYKTNERYGWLRSLDQSESSSEDNLALLDDNSISPQDVKFVIPYLEALSPRSSLSRLVQFVPVSPDSEEKTIVDVFDEINIGFKIDLNAYDPNFVYTGRIYFNKLQD